MKEMTCREFDELVHGYVRMELLDMDLRESALEHAAHCELCSQRMADAGVLAEGLEFIGRNAREAETPSHVQAALSAAFRDHHRRAYWRRSLEWASVGAAAAVLLVFLFTANWHSKGQVSPATRKEVTSQPALPVEAKAPAAAKPDDATVAAAATTKDAPESDTYLASDFVPVPFTGAISADDPGMIVRVQLTRASLAQLGYPVAETPDEDLISADILVGEDGWPRGVKLIQ